MRLRLVITVLLISSFASAQQAQQRRIVRPVDNASAVRLQGTLAPRARAALDRGAVASDLRLDRMTMVFSRTAAQQAELDRLLAAQHDPSSLNYHRWLTPEEFGDRFGVAEGDVNLVAVWLAAQGFSVDEIARSRTWIAFSGTAAQVEAAFHAPLHNYMVAGKLHFAPSVEAAVPDAFAPVVSAITGLNDFRPRPHSKARHVDPRLTSSLSGNHFLVPGDFGTIYNLPDYMNGTFQSGNDGTGQTIGVVGQSSTSGTVAVSTLSSDNATFRSLGGLPTGSLTLTPVGSPPSNFATGDFSEASLDIQWSGAIAPNANIIFAYSQDALNTSLASLVNQNIATVISISYGDCEANFSSGEYTNIEGALAQANAQGQTVTVAGGDLGAADCDGTPQNPTASATHGLAIDYPSSSVYVTALGGTQFSGDDPAVPVNGVAPATQYWNSSSDPNDTRPSAFSYIPEVVWNEVSSGTNVGTGGGVSKKFAKPSWQVGSGVPADGRRDIPDVSFASSSSHDGYLICSQSSCETGYRRNSDQTFTVIGGTSVAAPAFAGVAALVNQSLNARQGNLNPKIYSLAASSPSVFHDITTGDNKVVCTVGTTDCTSSPIGFAAGPGYDLATGWGSVSVAAFISALNLVPPNFTLTVASPVLSIPSGTAITDNLTVTAVGGFNSDVALTCSVPGSLGTTRCTIVPPTVVGGSGTALITITGATLSREMGAPLPFQHRGLGIYASYVVSLGFVFLGSPVAGRRRRRTGVALTGILKKALFALLVLGVMCGALSCGGGSGNGPTPITGNITITGVGGGITQTATINVTVH